MNIEKKLDLNFFQKLWHHFPTSLFIFVGGFLHYEWTQHPEQGLLISFIISYTLTIPAYFYIESKLNFIAISISIDRQEFIKRLFQKAEKNRWGQVSDYNEDTKRLEFRKSYSGHSYSDITIDIEDKIIYLNVRGAYPVDKKIINEIKSIVD